MKKKRLKPLDWVIVALVAVALVGLAGILVWEWLQQERPNYTYIADGLYMGGLTDAPPPGTSAVLNLCRINDPYRESIDEYCWKPISDGTRAPSLDWLRERVKFIETQQQKRRTIFVHCQQGVSRAGMVVTAYYMYKNNWTRDKALAFIRSKRPEVRPNPGFMKRLLEWEKGLQKGE